MNSSGENGPAEATAQAHDAGPGMASVRVDGNPMLAIWHGGRLLPLSEAARRCGGPERVPASAREALSDWDLWCSVIEEAARDAADDQGWLAEEDVTFLPAITDPPTIYCAGANYYDHVKEMRGAAPSRSETEAFHFLAPPSALAGHRGTVVRPVGCEHFDWEVELAVVIGVEARNVTAADAASVIAGYCVANDLSLRDFARRQDTRFFPDWLRSKCYEGCLPLGPAVVPARYVPDPMELDLTLTVNGHLRQASSTKQMIISVAEQIEYLSHILPLRPGDVISTGTPAGTAKSWGFYLDPGDVMVAEVAGLGRLQTRVLAAQPDQRQE